jgi:hypothetical protein
MQLIIITYYIKFKKIECVGRSGKKYLQMLMITIIIQFKFQNIAFKQEIIL